MGHYEQNEGQMRKDGKKEALRHQTRGEEDEAQREREVSSIITEFSNETEVLQGFPLDQKLRGQELHIERETKHIFEKHGSHCEVQETSRIWEIPSVLEH